MDPTKLKQDLRVFQKLMNLQDCVWENHYQIIMKTILQEKETIHYSNTIFGSQIYSYASSYEKFLQQKQRWTRDGKNGEIFGMESDESQKQERGDWWSKDVGRESSLCIINGHMSFVKCWIGGKTPKIQRSSCTPRWYCKRRFLVLRSIHRTRIISIWNVSRQNHGYHLQITRLRWTSSRRSISFIPKWKWEMLTNCSKFQNRNVQTFGFVYHDTNCLNHGPVWKIQSFLLSEICTVILWQDCYGKGNLRTSYWSTVGRRFPIGNAHSYTVKKGHSYPCMWMT